MCVVILDRCFLMAKQRQTHGTTQRLFPTIFEVGKFYLYTECGSQLNKQSVSLSVHFPIALSCRTVSLSMRIRLLSFCRGQREARFLAPHSPTQQTCTFLLFNLVEPDFQIELPLSLHLLSNSLSTQASVPT